MNKPSEMTNAELADWITSDIWIFGCSSAKRNNLTTQIGKRLRAIPEPPKPEFHVGWKGFSENGVEVEIYGEAQGFLYGRFNKDAHSWAHDGTTITGEDSKGVNSCFNLIPNTPEPEVMWRYEGDNHLYDEQSEMPKILAKPLGTLQKVEVRVVK